MCIHSARLYARLFTACLRHLFCDNCFATQLYTAAEASLHARTMWTGGRTRDELLHPILQTRERGRLRDGRAKERGIHLNAQDHWWDISVTFCTVLLLQLLMHLPRSGVNNAKAVKAWKLLQPYISSSKSAGAKKYVSPFCIVSWRIPY